MIAARGRAAQGRRAESGVHVPTIGAVLTPRQELILRKVVEAHLEDGRRLGSHALAEQEDVTWRASTIRHELASLEEVGLLDHPHTSAGRVPTEAGLRYFVDRLLTRERCPSRRWASRSSGASSTRRCASRPRRFAGHERAGDRHRAAATTATIRHVELIPSSRRC